MMMMMMMMMMMISFKNTVIIFSKLPNEVTHSLTLLAPVRAKTSKRVLLQRCITGYITMYNSSCFLKPTLTASSSPSSERRHFVTHFTLRALLLLDHDVVVILHSLTTIFIVMGVLHKSCSFGDSVAVCGVLCKMSSC